MPRGLLISIHFHDGRYHGQPEWPPSPARLFQALLAGAAKGHALSAEDREALAWLEQLRPPIISAPAARRGRGFKNYVPNNDLDAVGGDPGRVSEIRTPKLIRPLLFDRREPLLYAWRFDEGDVQAKRICAMAELLYQLGRGVDMAWARGEIVEEREIEPRLADNRGAVYRPSDRGDGLSLSCPLKGSLESLEIRFEQTRLRLASAGKEALLSQPPQPRFPAIPYESPPDRKLFELRKEDDFAPWPLARVAALVETVRDRAAGRLKETLPDIVALVDRILVGRGAEEADKAARIRIIPLPSIGARHVVSSVRRVLIEIPANCPLPADDVAWAFSGLDVVDPDTGEVKGNLVSADDRGMLNHYGIGVRDDYRAWRTITPAALPASAARRRIDPVRLSQELTAGRKPAAPKLVEAKGSEERLQEEQRAKACVVQALRHAGIAAPAESIRVQREPFDSNGARAEAFASAPRFAKERLWHVEIAFIQPVQGPLSIGDGRYLGLGVMAPVKDVWRDVVAFSLSTETNIGLADSGEFIQATRRALMALSRDVTGEISRLFSGHEDDGAPAASGSHEHIFLAADDADGDGRIDRLMVAAPWVCDRSVPADRRMQKDFEEVVSGLKTVRAGRLGVIDLGSPEGLADGDALVGPARGWETRTPYRATRHAKRRQDRRDVIVRDILAECSRRQLPIPEVEIAEWKALPQGGGLAARVRLRFASALRGPLLLGRDSHRGGGVFAAEFGAL